jgi:hypothetical protein
MSDNYLGEVLSLRRQAGALPDGRAKVALLEEAVRLADTHQDVPCAYWTRGDLVKAGTFGGQPEKALVAFTWRLAQSDRAPEQFPPEELLWEFKWVVDSLGGFPQISRQQVEDLLADMTRRYQQAGANLRPVHKLRCVLAREMCDKAAARKHFAEWVKTPRGWPSDCPACDQNHVVRFQAYLGHDESALEEARPILDGSMRCAEIPHVTLALVLLPLMRLGEAAEAMPLHQKGYRMIGRNPKFLPEAAAHLTFLTLTDNLPRAMRLLEKHLPWAQAATDLKARFEFLNAVRLLLERLTGAGKDAIRLHLPPDFPAFREDGHYEVAALRGWFDETAAELAGRFDARNGNDGFTKALRAELKLSELVQPCPLPHAGKDE